MLLLHLPNFPWTFLDVSYHPTGCHLCPTDAGMPFVDIHCSYHNTCQLYCTVRWSATIVNTPVPMLVAGMFDVDFVLLWARPYTSETPFQPRSSRSMSSSVIPLLLILSGSVHVNPGPDVRFATLYKWMNKWMKVKQLGELKFWPKIIS